MSKVTSYVKHRVKGFTLIELLIVITIIGILAVALIPRIASSPARARDVQRKADLNNISSALELYYSDNGAYPVSTDVCVSTVSMSGYIQGGTPSDPSDLANAGCTTGGYAYVGDASGYIIYGQLEVDTATGDNICPDGDVSGTTADDVSCATDATYGPIYYIAR